MYQFKPNKIKELRDKLGYSFKDFGRRIDSSKQLIQQWECGAVTPNVKSLLRICNEYGVSPRSFFATKPNNNRPS